MAVYIPVYKLREEDILSIFYKLPPIVYHNNKYCYEFGNGTLTERILTTMMEARYEYKTGSRLD